MTKMEESINGTTQESRRNFLKFILSSGLVALAGAVLYPILVYLKPPKQGEVEVSSVKAGKLSEIEKESGQIVKFGTKPVILIRTANGDLRAFSATCTHLDCTVQFQKDFGLIWCACHNGKYDLNGRNVSGPPPRPLDEYRVVVQGDDVFVSKKA
jgi:cytochrome b6-f complex iron-sulfur subunit